ncbi:MAG: BRCT domain-containing protein [Ruminococcus sp.]|nr:BRCT domain-containing protein [Ruminococcus sp.]
MTSKCLEIMHKEAVNRYSDENAFFRLFAKKTLSANDLSATTENFDESHILYGKSCVFTGALERMTRREAMQIVLDHGGICEDKVTKRTNYLILGNNDYCSRIKDGKSSKQKKAEKYKLEGQEIDIIPENVFYDMLKF